MCLKIPAKPRRSLFFSSVLLSNYVPSTVVRIFTCTSFCIHISEVLNRMLKRLMLNYPEKNQTFILTFIVQSKQL